MEKLQCLAILLGAIVLYATRLVPVEVTSIGIVIALVLAELLAPAEALSGFSNPGTLIVASMLVLSAGLQRAGVVDYVAGLLGRWATGGPRRVLLVLALPTAAFSAFMNNTPVVALMIPVALALGARASVSPSRLLLPLSYLSILGGTCTLLGTSTNILVAELSREAGGPEIGMFAFAGPGLVCLAAGALYLLLVAPRLLPARPVLGQLLSARAPGRFVTEVVVPDAGPYPGRPIGQAFPTDRDVTVLEVVRDEEPLLQPGPDFALRSGDVVFIESTAKGLHGLLAREELDPASAVADGERVQIGQVDLHIAEAVVTPNSRAIGRQVRGLGLTRRHGIQVLALRRGGRHHARNLRERRLRAGDVLLVQGEPESLHTWNEEGDVLLVEGVAQELTFPRRAPAALLVFAAVVSLAAAGAAPLVVLALGGVAAMLALRCIDVRQAARAVDPTVVLLLAGTLPLGLAFERSGLAADVASYLIGLGNAVGPVGLLTGVFLVASLLSAVLSNAATAVLLLPVVLDLAGELELAATPLLIALAIGASASFVTPIGYQTNTLVMGPGGYRFRDYMVLGLPLTLVLAGAVTASIPLFWPLR